MEDLPIYKLFEKNHQMTYVHLLYKHCNSALRLKYVNIHKAMFTYLKNLLSRPTACLCVRAVKSYAIPRWWASPCAVSGRMMVSDSPLSASIRPAASHLLVTPRERDLTLPSRSCTQWQTHAHVRERKKPTPFTDHIWCQLLEAFKKKNSHICFFKARGTIMSLLTT